MVEYRQKATMTTTTTTTGPSSQPPRTTAAAPSRAPTFMRLASSLQTQTIEQEFQAYITSHLSTEGTDIIKFWEVRASKDK
jgi:hypothetical protein